MSRELRIAPTLSLPLDAVTETFAILAKRRAGKSNAAVVMAEEMYDAGLPWVAVDPKGDWWGVRAAGDGKAPGLAVLVFGGLHGDVPLEPTAGRLVADLIVEQRLTCVLDVSEMSKADQRRFLVDFADRLYRRNTEPLHVFCEEADEYIPQRVTQDVTKLVNAWERLVKRGGFRGIGITLITQRSASLNKDVLTQIETLIPMRTPSPQDRKAILAWVDYHASGAEAVSELPGLADGEAWVFSPQWLNTLTKIRFRRRRTFDSGATPKVGGKPRPPATLADVDLATIKEAMAETIEKAKADDPRELRQRITVLERELATERARQPEPVVERVEVPAVDDDTLDRLADAVDALRQVAPDLVEALTRVQVQRGTSVSIPPRRHAEPPRRPAGGPRPTPTTTRDITQAKVGGLGKGERTILAAIAQHAGGVTAEHLSVLTGYKRSSRNTYLQRLKAADCVESRGGQILATDVGIETLGSDYEPLPTGVALRDHWLEKLPEGERRILADLIDAWPNSVTGDELDTRTGYKRSSRNTYLQRLRARQLITSDSGSARAADVLMRGADV